MKFYYKIVHHLLVYMAWFFLLFVGNIKVVCVWQSAEYIRGKTADVKLLQGIGGGSCCWWDFLLVPAKFVCSP
jgi:hypothetical protein